MSIGNLTSNLKTSILGAPEKAVLTIVHNDAPAASPNPAGLAQSALRGEPGSTVTAKTHKLVVQYNPSTLKIQANAESIEAKRLQKKVTEDIPNAFTRPPSIVLTVDLIFDAVNVKDSFMADKFRLSAGDVVTDVAAVINRANYTVQPQTNALLAMLHRKGTSNVVFAWRSMSFWGNVEEVQARYTMFSVSGRPVRSVVTFAISQESKNIKDTYWENAMDKCFGEATAAGEYGGQSVGQSVGNLLNLGF
jgi:hypothetical protein